MSLGSAVGAVLLLVWASVEDLWVFYLVWAGIGLAMAATLYEPAFAVLAKWFERRRAQALLLVTLARASDRVERDGQRAASGDTSGFA
jgi:uncharacterized membrane protein YedE/YeeE